MYLLSRIQKQARLGIVPALSLLFVLLLSACDAGATATSTLAPSATATQAPATASPTAELATATPAPQSRTEIETYAVQAGDTLSSIAAQFGLQPETVLWANYELLRDNPDWLTIDMQLTILPVDGVYHQVGGGETLTSIASFFVAEVQDIIDWPANGLSGADPVIFNSQWLLVPDGRRANRFRRMPNVPADAAQLDIAEFGSGACPADYANNLVGDGVYAWPLASQAISPEGFAADWHPGIDLAAQLGDEVLAADDGVVVFSGWSNLGYGNMVMLDHGNGDYSVYAGLGQVSATCGRTVSQGETLGLAGISNHPAGAFVHFELRRGDQFLDPLSLLPSD